MGEDRMVLSQIRINQWEETVGLLLFSLTDYPAQSEFPVTGDHPVVAA